jgi:hypothetical protein
VTSALRTTGVGWVVGDEGELRAGGVRIRRHPSGPEQTFDLPSRQERPPRCSGMNDSNRVLDSYRRVIASDSELPAHRLVHRRPIVLFESPQRKSGTRQPLRRALSSTVHVLEECVLGFCNRSIKTFGARFAERDSKQLRLHAIGILEHNG